MSAVDWSNPCARADALRSAYYRRLSGEAEVEILTRTLDSEQRVRFAEGSEARLLDELRAAESQCHLAGGPVPTTAPRRFAITAGARRRIY